MRGAEGPHLAPEKTPCKIAYVVRKYQAFESAGLQELRLMPRPFFTCAGSLAAERALRWLPPPALHCRPCPPGQPSKAEQRSHCPATRGGSLRHPSYRRSGRWWHVRVLASHPDIVAAACWDCCEVAPGGVALV